MSRQNKYGTLFFFLMVLVIAWHFTAVPFIVYGHEFGMSLVHTFAVALVGALALAAPYWLLPRSWRPLSWLPVALSTAWGISQLWYARTYNDIMPLQVFTLTGNVNSLLIDSVLGSVRWADLWIIVPTLLLLLLPVKKIAHAFPLWTSPNYHHESQQRLSRRVRPFAMTVALALLMCVLTNVNLLWRGKGMKQAFDERYATCFVNARYCGENGIIPYLLYSAHEWRHSYQPLTTAEKEQLNAFNKQLPSYSNNPYGTPGKKNLIMVIIESMQSWPIGMKIDGREVTPTLNQLLKKQGTISCLNVVSQISYGHSSDGHFIYDTGLLPLLQESVAISFGDNNFMSLPKALTGYDRREVMVNEAQSWNQTVTPFSYGFQKLYARQELDAALKRNNNIDDNALFDFVNQDLLPHMKQPFMLQMVTLTMHTPHKTGKLPQSWLTQSKAYNELGRNFLNEVNNLDNCLASLYKRLHELKLDSNTVVAIVSDHNEVDLNEVEGRPIGTLRDTAIPMIVTGTNVTLHRNSVMGQIDIYPTLLDVMGANHYPWKGLGHSILRYPVTSAVSKRQQVVGKPNALTPHQQKAWSMSPLYIRNLSK